MMLPYLQHYNCIVKLKLQFKLIKNAILMLQRKGEEMSKNKRKSLDEYNQDSKTLHNIFNDKKFTVYDCRNTEIEEMLSHVPNFAGLIVLFEDGEKFNEQKRIVFVGYSKNVHKRVQEYFYDKERNATLKRHIGDALINTEIKNGTLAQENLGLWWDYENKDRFEQGNYREIEEKIIREVQKHIKSHFSFVLLPVKNATHRRTLAWRMLSTLSHSEIKPSENWLGNNSSHFQVHESGLWAMRTFKSKKFMEDRDFELLENYLKGEL